MGSQGSSRLYKSTRPLAGSVSMRIGAGAVRNPLVQLLEVVTVVDVDRVGVAALLREALGRREDTQQRHSSDQTATTLGGLTAAGARCRRMIHSATMRFGTQQSHEIV